MSTDRINHVSILPVQLDGLQFTLPPGEYLLPWTWTDEQRARLAGILVQGLAGVRFAVDLPWTLLPLRWTRGEGRDETSLLTCRIPAGTPEVEITRGMMPLKGIPYRFIQREDPQINGYGWQERYLKPALLPWLTGVLGDPSHPLARYGAASTPVAEAAGLCTDIIEIIEIIEETLYERMQLESRLSRLGRSFREVEGIDAPDELGALVTIAQGLGVSTTADGTHGSRQRTENRGLLLNIAGRRLGTRLATLAEKPEVGQRAVALLADPDGASLDAESLAAAQALEKLGLGTVVGSSLALGPLARQAREPSVWGGLVAPLATRGLPYPQPPEVEATADEERDLVFGPVARRLRRCIVMPEIRVVPNGADLSRWMKEIARQQKFTSSLLNQICDAVAEVCDALEQGERVDDELRGRCVGLIRAAESAHEGNDDVRVSVLETATSTLFLAYSMDNDLRMERLKAYNTVLRLHVNLVDLNHYDCSHLVAMAASLLYCAGVHPVDSAPLTVDLSRVQAQELLYGGAMRLMVNYLSCSANLHIKHLSAEVREELGTQDYFAASLTTDAMSAENIVDAADLEHVLALPSVILMEYLLRQGRWEQAQLLIQHLYNAIDAPQPAVSTRARMGLVYYFGLIGAFDEAGRQLDLLLRGDLEYVAYAHYLQGWLTWIEGEPGRALGPLALASAEAMKYGNKRLLGHACIVAGWCLREANSTDHAAMRETLLAALLSGEPDCLSLSALVNGFFGLLFAESAPAAQSLSFSVIFAHQAGDQDRYAQYELLHVARIQLGEQRFYALIRDANPSMEAQIRTFLDAPPPAEPPEPPQRPPPETIF